MESLETGVGKSGLGGRDWGGGTTPKVHGRLEKIFFPSQPPPSVGVIRVDSCLSGLLS